MSKPWTAAALPSLTDRLALVTGANSGLGLETTAALAAAGAQVIMACRDPARSEAARAEVLKRTPQARVSLMALDLADLSSVRAFAAAFAKTHAHLDLLINNAGVMALPLQRTADGFERQIGTNHLGHFALTGLLLDALRAAPAARVVNVASLAHRWTRAMDLDDLNFERRRYEKWDAYGKSKLANLLFTFELDRRLRASGARVLVAAAHPGYASTNLQFAGPQAQGSAFMHQVMRLGNALIGQPAVMGALPTLYAAGAADMQSGDYFGPDGFKQLRGHPVRVGCRAAARDPQTASALWRLSESLTGVRYL